MSVVVQGISQGKVFREYVSRTLWQLIPSELELECNPASVQEALESSEADL